MCKRRSTDYRLLEQLEGPQININFNLDLGASKTRQLSHKVAYDSDQGFSVHLVLHYTSG